MKISVAQLNPTVGDFHGNCEKVLAALKKGKAEGAQMVLFSECVLTGYPPEDFVLLPDFIDNTEKALQSIVPHTEGICAIIGLPTRNSQKGEKPLHNSAAIIIDKKLIGYQHKLLLPTYDVFDERRYFEPGTDLQTWNIFGERVAITICEDIWEGSTELKESRYFRNILKTLHEQKPTLFLNLSASPYHSRKVGIRMGLCKKAATTLDCPVILCNQVGGNDCYVFDGNSISMNNKGELIKLGRGFSEDQYLIDTSKPNPPADYTLNAEEELYHALVLGLRDYFHKSKLSKACLGLSGGIDSALVACIAADALGKENVLGLLMPSRYSSKGSLDDAYALARNLQIQCKEIPIEAPHDTYLKLLSSHFEGSAPDITEENLQARIRGMLLMAFSNKFGYTTLATGNKSELAMGYCTLYGDMCGGLAVIGDVTKTQVYAVSKWINRDKEIIPQSSIDKPPSAELKPDQKDSDTLPDYAVLDNILQAHVEDYLPVKEIAKLYGYPEKLVEDVIKKIYRNEFKRRQAPPVLRISKKAFTAGRRFPIVQKYL